MLKWINRLGASLTLLFGLVVLAETVVAGIHTGQFFIFTPEPDHSWRVSLAIIGPQLIVYFLMIVLISGGIWWSRKAWRSPREEAVVETEVE